MKKKNEKCLLLKKRISTWYCSPTSLFDVDVNKDYDKRRATLYLIIHAFDKSTCTEMNCFEYFVLSNGVVACLTKCAFTYSAVCAFRRPRTLSGMGKKTQEQPPSTTTPPHHCSTTPLATTGSDSDLRSIAIGSGRCGRTIRLL